MGAYAPKYTDRGIYEKACEMDRNNKDIPEVWTGENLSHEEMSISFQIRKLLLYVHDHPVETTHGHYL